MLILGILRSFWAVLGVLTSFFCNNYYEAKYALMLIFTLFPCLQLILQVLRGQLHSNI